ncbi:MAG TPA: ABC transporter substrate-binding protein [Noviherbaspirillum sp.]|jgi:ABC-type branched-subunit amino acid transport system substrate-binding protein|uniref:ABC transporter substrate-binding protein n=1 Tax=Noviherbaspirillum sp. TaxID=1926288 RepID=UPI002DDDA0FB|nr:ABC transporter substrate-binding protein [Noviherbaspirillum sp.]HEV2610183.1 ABC transporter substrate-binding protein [Noviherbaspirillum sp.]
MKTSIQQLLQICLKTTTTAFIALSLTSAPVHAQAAAEDEILFGKTSSLSGPLAEIGVDATTATNAYFEYINQQGGIHGRKLRLLTLDDSYSTEKGVANARQLIEKEKAFALLNMAGTPTNKALLPIIAEHNIPSIGPYTGSDIVRTPHNRLIFNIRAGYSDEAATIVKHLEIRGIKKIAVVYQNNAFGKEGLGFVENATEAQKMKVHASAPMEASGADAEKAAAVLAESQPQAVIMITTGKSSVEFIKAFNKISPGMQFFALSVMGTQAGVNALGKDGIGVVVSQVAPFPFSATSGIVREYQKVMKQMGVKNWSFASMEGFITAKVVVEGLRRAGKNPTRERFIAGLESIGRWDMDGYLINFSKDNHNGSRYVELTAISREGRFLR